MKLTNKDLRRIIKEELSYVLSEKSKTKRSARISHEVESYLITLADTIFASSNSEQLEKGVFFWDDRGHHLKNFTIVDALDQLSGNQVQLGDEVANRAATNPSDLFQGAQSFFDNAQSSVSAQLGEFF